MASEITFKKFSNKKTEFEFKIYNENEILHIESNSINSFPSKKYSSKFLLKNLKFNRYFRLFRNVDDILLELKNQFNKSVIFEENKKLVLVTPVTVKL